MKALLLKDFLTLTRYLKLALVFILVFACLPGESMAACALVYAAMIPLTALAYDEQVKWNRLAAMMPYTSRQLVVSKYVLGYLLLGLAFLLSLAASSVVSLVRGSTMTVESLVTLAVLVCVASVLMAITFPLSLHFGVEKGRLVLLLGVAAFTGFLFLLGDSQGLMTAMDASPLTVTAVFLVVCVAVNALSIPLSVRIYNRKNRQ